MVKWSVEHKSIVMLLTVVTLIAGFLLYGNMERQENPSQIEHKPVMTETILNFGEAVLTLTDKLAAYMETK